MRAVSPFISLFSPSVCVFVLVCELIATVPGFGIWIDRICERERERGGNNILKSGTGKYFMRIPGVYLVCRLIEFSMFLVFLSLNLPYGFLRFDGGVLTFTSLNVFHNNT